MQIQVHTDNHIQGSRELSERVTSNVEHALDRFASQITRVDVHLGDDNGSKAGDDDKRCLLEARVAGLDPIAASHHADSLEAALSGALHTLERNLDRTFDRIGHKKGRTSYSGE